MYRTAGSSGAVGTFCLKFFPKAGATESLLSVLAAFCSHPEVSGLRAVQDGHLPSCCTTQTTTISDHAGPYSMFKSVKFKRNRLHCLLKFPCLIVFLLDCVSSRQELWQRPPHRQAVRVGGFQCLPFMQAAHFLSRAAFANLRCCETDPKGKSSPNPICSHDMWEKDGKRRPNLPVFAGEVRHLIALQSNLITNAWMRSAASTTSAMNPTCQKLSCF